MTTLPDLLGRLGATPEFAHLVDDPADWVVALCAAWARQAGTVRFYNERLLADALLATAADPDAVTRLGRSLGRAAPPHLTATTYLSYTVKDTVAGVDAVTRARSRGTGATADHRARASGPPVPAGVVTTIEAGSLVRSVPRPGELPQVYATLAPLDAYAGVSRPAVALPDAVAAPGVTGRTTEVELAGVATGLVPGRPVLVAARAATGEPVTWARRLTSVRADAARGATRIGWAEPLGGPDAFDVVVHAFDTATPLFGATAAAWDSLPLPARLATPTAAGTPVPPVGGLVASADRGVSWTPAGLPPGAVPRCVAAVAGLRLAGTDAGLYVADRDRAYVLATGLPRRPVLCAGGSARRLLAGTATGAVYESPDRGRTWHALTGGPPVVRRVRRTPRHPRKAREVVRRALPNAPVHAVVDTGSLLLAGTGRGAYRYERGSWLPDWPHGAVLALLPHDERVYAATSRGVGVRFADGAWREVGRLHTAAFALARLPGGHLAAATADGVRVHAEGRWHRRDGTGGGALPGGPVTTLAAVADVLLAAPAAGGLYRSTDAGRTWARCDDEHVFDVPADAALAACAFDGQGYPAGPDARFRLVPSGSRTRVLLGAAFGVVRGLAAGGGMVLAATAPGGAAADEWPGYGVAGRVLDLAKPVRGVAAGSFVVLDGDRPLPATVTGAERARVAAFGTAAVTTRLTVDRDLPPGALDRRIATVWTGPRALPLFRSGTPVPVVRGDRIALAEPRTGWPAGRVAIVTGRPVGVAVAPLGGVVGVCADGWLRPPLYEADAYGVAVTAAGDVVVTATDGRHLIPGGTRAPLTFDATGDATDPSTVTTPDGAVWSARPTGLWRRDPSTRRRHRDPAISAAVLALGADSETAPVVVTATEMLRRNGSRWSTRPLPPGVTPTAVALGPDGTAWVALASRLGVAHVPLPRTPPVTAADLATLDQGGLPAALTGRPLDPASVVVPRVPGACWVVRSGTEVYVLALRSDGRTRWLAVAAAPPLPADLTANAPAADVVLLPATADTPEVAEVVETAGVDPPATLRLAAPLAHVYDATTVTLHLNVVAAAHGRPVSVPIGSGDPGLAHQAFAVPTPVAAVAVGGDPTTTLRIAVAGRPWQRVPALAAAGPADEVYQMVRGPEGGVVVRFGDGERGARLPAGRDNVVATYLTGGGPDGEAAAGTLVQPLDRPQLVTAVVNPVAALRPALPDAVSDAEVAARGRAVSLPDLVATAESVPGVASASARVVAARGGRVVTVTVARAPDAPTDLAGVVGARLADVAIPGLRVHVVEATYVRVAATVADPLAAAALAGRTAERPGAPLRMVDVAGIARIVAWGRVGTEPTAAPDLAARPGELLVLAPDLLDVRPEP